MASEQAETIKQIVTNGAMLSVQGGFTTNQYMAEDGKPEVSLEVTIEEFSFADGSKPQGSEQ